MEEKEPRNNKTQIKIQVQYIKPIRQNSWKNIPQQFHKMSDGLTKKFSHTIKVNVEDISNKDKLAYVIMKWFGYGTMNILFYNRYCKSSKYNPNFRCLVQRGKQCKFKDNGKCKGLWKRHKKGFSCSKNRRIRPNWSKRAKITIYPKETYDDIDYEYKWHKRDDRMYYFWFWKDMRR